MSRTLLLRSCCEACAPIMNEKSERFKQLAVGARKLATSARSASEQQSLLDIAERYERLAMADLPDVVTVSE